MLPLDALDRMLSAWDERLRRVDDNLLALESDPAYQITSGPGAHERYDGASRQQIQQAQQEIATLFGDLERLRAVIEQARTVRAALRGLLWGKDEKLALLDHLLTGPSVSRGHETSSLERRSLLDAGPRERAIAPDALLAEMARRYEAARDGLLGVWRAWQSLEPSVHRVEQQLRQLDEATVRLGLGPTALDGLVALRAEVARVRAQTARDPLGAPRDFEPRLAPRFQIVRNGLQVLETRWQSATTALRRAADELQALRKIHRAIAERWRDLAPRLALGPAAARLLPPVADLDALDRALASLLEPGGWQLTDALASWTTLAAALRARLELTDQRITALHGALVDLPGRLSARRAQLAAYAARGLHVPPELPRCADEIEALLARSPCPLGLAVAHLELLERALRPRP